MVYLIWASLGCLSFAFKKNKYVTALTFAFIAILFCFNTANADLNNYTLQFNGLRFYASEPLYNFFSNLVHSAGADFIIYRAILSMVSLALITRTLYQLTPYPTLALFMYSIYPLTLDVTQIRYTIGYSIVFWGVYYLIRYQNTHEKKDIIIFFLSILIATGFHYVCAMFAILGLVLLDIKKHRLLYIVLIPAIVIVVLTMFDRFAPLISNVIGLHKTDLWVFTERDSSIMRIGRILVSRGMPMLFSLLLAFTAKNAEYKSICGGGTASVGLINPNADRLYLPELDPQGYYNIRTNRCMFICMFYIWVFSILEITIAGDYERLARLGLLIGSALITRQLFYLEKVNRRIMVVLYLCMFVIYFLFIMYFMKNKAGELYISYVFRQVMESNSIFGITYR